MAKFLSSFSMLLLVGTPAAAATCPGVFAPLGHMHEPGALVVVGAGFFVIGFMRRRPAGG
jgi:hypothetical protein